MTDAGEYEQSSAQNAEKGTFSGLGAGISEPLGPSSITGDTGERIYREPYCPHCHRRHAFPCLTEPALEASDKPKEGGDPTLGERPHLAECAARMRQAASLARGGQQKAAEAQAGDLLVAALRDLASCVNDAGRKAISDLLFAFDEVRRG